MKRFLPYAFYTTMMLMMLGVCYVKYDQDTEKLKDKAEKAYNLGYKRAYLQAIKAERIIDDIPERSRALFEAQINIYSGSDSVEAPNPLEVNDFTKINRWTYNN